MDVEKQMQDALRLSQEENEKGKKKYQSDSRARLFKITSTKVRTAFIGALSSFEQNFGELWGHRLPESELTDEQLEWKQLWEECRTAVLNNGNHQIRAVENEMGQYLISWNRHQTFLKTKEDKDECQR